MKKHITLIGLNLFIAACSNFPERETTKEEVVKPSAIAIEHKNLTTPCECVDALSFVISEMIAITKDHPISETSMDDLLVKLDEVEDYCMDTLGFTKSEAAVCNGFDQLESKFDAVENFIK